MTNAKEFIVYRRTGNRLTPHRARLVARRWVDGQPEGWRVQVGQEVAWADLYAGHTAWVGEQVARHRDAVKRAKAQRAARRADLNKGAN